MSVIAGFVVPHPPMIVPQVGRGSEKQVQDTIDAYMEVAAQIGKLKPDTIVISSPHATMYTDYFCISSGSGAQGTFARFNAPEVSFDEKYDEEFIEALEKTVYEADFPAGTMGDRNKELDHGVMVPLYFIEKFYRDFKLVRIGLSGLELADHYRMGQFIETASLSLGRRTAYVASGDLSHKLQEYGPYGFAPAGSEYDKRIMDVLKRGAFGEMLEFDEDFCDRAAECGHRSFVMMAGAFDKRAVESEVYCHQDVTGVGYGVASFYAKGRDESRNFLDKYLEERTRLMDEKRATEDEYVQLARATVESYVRQGKVPDVTTLEGSELLNKRAGAFVSIHKNGRLRGCIGTILPVRENLAQEIIHNAVSAATQDPRFEPITAGELPFLDIKVDELMPPEDIASAGELDVKKYGVIVTNGMRRGLLLPDLEGVDTVEQQIDIARQKAGIGSHEKLKLQRFEVIRHY